MAETTASSEVTRHCSPAYFAGALVADEAPPGLIVKLTRGYATALEQMDDAGLYEWTSAMASNCLSRGWQEAAIAMLATESEGLKTHYLKQAEKILDLLDHKED